MFGLRQHGEEDLAESSLILWSKMIRAVAVALLLLSSEVAHTVHSSINTGITILRFVFCHTDERAPAKSEHYGDSSPVTLQIPSLYCFIPKQIGSSCMSVTVRSPAEDHR